MQPWQAGSGPEPDELRKLIVEDGYNDTEIAQQYGVTRQTAAYWRMKIGILRPGRGHGPNAGRQRQPLSHKHLVHWRVKNEHMNDPIRKRLVMISRRQQGVNIGEADGRLADQLLAYLRDSGTVVNYDPEREDPFHFVPRDPKIDAADDIVRR